MKGWLEVKTDFRFEFSGVEKLLDFFFRCLKLIFNNKGSSSPTKGWLWVKTDFRFDFSTVGNLFGIFFRFLELFLIIG
jgi:hypothetical protein